jgi:ferredoxin, 2Fe-2S
MPKITYVEYSGREHRVEVPLGRSVMRGAVDNSIPGIDADCGGECACATCHVYVDESWLGATGTPVPGSQEASMLSFAALAQPNSRLSCQITVSEALDGLVVRMPEGQTPQWHDDRSVGIGPIASVTELRPAMLVPGDRGPHGPLQTGVENRR